MKNEDVSMFKLMKHKHGTKAFRYVSCPDATIKRRFFIIGGPCHHKDH